MKIAVASDLHLEWDRNLQLHNEELADVLVLAGDIVPIASLRQGKNVKHYIEFFEDLASKFAHVLYVVGNHEYYGGDISTDIATVIKILGHIDNLTVLDDATKQIGDVTFVGATLWTDFDQRDPIKMMVASRGMIDYRAITQSSVPTTFRTPNGRFATRPSKLTPDDTADRHQVTKQLIDTVASNSEASKVVVITHHAPSHLSSHDRYRGDPLNSSFCSDLTDLMEDNPNIKLWIHGHTHDPFDYVVYNTRVVCNPRGYPGEQAFLNFSIQYVEV